MRVRRTEKLVVYLEPAIFAALQKVIERNRESTGDNISNSDYGREVIVNHLRELGMLPMKVLQEIV